MALLLNSQLRTALLPCSCHLRSPSSRRYVSLALDSKGKSKAPAPADEGEAWSTSLEWEAELRRRQKRAKERGRKGPTFVDRLQVKIRAGRGGDGGVAFHREKFIAFGGPSGGNGGPGGSVYLRPNASIQTLSAIDRRIRAPPGGNGKGGWMHGKGGGDVVVDVPVGTVIREVREVEDEVGRRPPRASDLEGEDPEVALQRRARLFVHYPEYEGENQEDPVLHQLELDLMREEWEARRARSLSPLLSIDFATDPSSASITGIGAGESVLVARGGLGGVGNAVFSGNQKKLPRFATRGRPGEEVELDLELKTLADVGLVGFPNAGKSTLIRTLTNSRAEVAPYAFTTLHPQIGTLVIYEDGSFSSPDSDAPIEDDPAVQDHFDGNRLATPLPPSARRDSSRVEEVRLTIADCPGLLPDASRNVGLGHDFLRHIERSSILVIVVDLAAGTSASAAAQAGAIIDDVEAGTDRPCRDVEVLLKELEAYRAGLSGRVSMVIANKADLFTPESPSAGHAVAVERLRMLERYVQEVGEGQVKEGIRDQARKAIPVIPLSAKLRQNVPKVVAVLRSHAKLLSQTADA